MAEHNIDMPLTLSERAKQLYLKSRALMCEDTRNPTSATWYISRTILITMIQEVLDTMLPDKALFHDGDVFDQMSYYHAYEMAQEIETQIMLIRAGAQLSMRLFLFPVVIVEAEDVLKIVITSELSLQES